MRVSEVLERVEKVRFQPKFNKRLQVFVWNDERWLRYIGYGKRGHNRKIQIET